MGRDEQFEIQYLLSLIVAILGIVSSKTLQQYIDEGLAYIFLTIVFLHLVVFNLGYSFGDTEQFKIPSVEYLKNNLWFSFSGISLLFLFLVLHIAGLFGLGTLTQCSPDVGFNLTSMKNPSGCPAGKMIISYGIPFLIVTTFAAGVVIKMVPPISLFKKTDVKISPSPVHVFSTFDETEPMLVKIENHSSSLQTFTVEIDLPDDVVARCDFGDEVEDEIEKTVEIESGRQAKIHLQLRYHGESKRRDVVGFNLCHEKGNRTEEVEALLQA